MDKIRKNWDKIWIKRRGQARWKYFLRLIHLYLPPEFVTVLCGKKRASQTTATTETETRNSKKRNSKKKNIPEATSIKGTTPSPCITRTLSTQVLSNLKTIIIWYNLSCRPVPLQTMYWQNWQFHWRKLFRENILPKHTKTKVFDWIIGSMNIVFI